MMDHRDILVKEIIVDNFAGGGGASTGIELATGRVVDIAINHDPAAILMHQTNHPSTTHYQVSVWDIDPCKVCGGRPVGLAWFSPDCKHFSKAKGGKPVDKNIRGLAWIALRWAGTVRPRVIILENVEEFVTWGPVRRGKPVKSKAGRTFRQFVKQLRDLGYKVEWRELVAADYGTPTIRKRFFMIARCDGRPIVWPEPTHAPIESEAVRSGAMKPWRGAAEVIDWSLPCPSIFDSKEEIWDKYHLKSQRPLRPNTLRRIARGLDKFVLKEPEPFLVKINHADDAPRVKDVSEPMPTITAKHGLGVSKPTLAPVLTALGQTGGGDRIRSITSPTHTAVSKQEDMLITPALIQYHSEQSEYVRGQQMNNPICTVDAANRYGLMLPMLVKYYGGEEHGQKVWDPLHTVTAKDREGLVAASLTKYFGGVVGADSREPMPTVTSVDHNAVQTAHIVKFKGQDVGQHQGTPLHTITAMPCYGLVRTTIVKAMPGADLHRWPQVRELLNTYCGYHLADDDVILLWVKWVAYIIADIGLRMLTPRELFLANGFPADYVIDRDYLGNKYQKSEQVARAGNAVCPPLATALVRVNLPEWCDKPTITSMAEFDMIAGIVAMPSLVR